MKISAIQKLTLLDFPGHVACTVFTAGCDFRCHYCQNSEFVLPEKLRLIEQNFIPEQVFFNFLQQRKNLLEGVCVTGGEPTIHSGLPEFLRKIKAMGFLTKLDTNGNNPDMLETLLGEKLVDYVALDIKASPKRYAEFTGTKSTSQINAIDHITRSRDILMNSGIKYEFRTTLIREIHNEEEFSAILEFVSGAEHYTLQNFQSRGGCLDPKWESHSGFSEGDLQKLRARAAQSVGTCEIRA